MKGSYYFLLLMIVVGLVMVVAVGGYAQERFTLRMSWWGGESRHKATLKAIELYESKNPYIKIEGEYGGWAGYLEKLVTQLAAGTAPDIMQIDIQFLDKFRKERDLFVDFNTLKEINLSVFDKNLLDRIRFSTGEIIGVPTGIAVSTFYVNKTLAEKVGVNYKALDWEGLLLEGEKLHSQHRDMYMLHMTLDYDLKDYVFEPYLLNITGKQFIDDNYNLGFDRASLVKAFEYILALYDKGVIQPPAETAYIKTGLGYQNPKWLNDKIIGILTLNSFYTAVKSSKPDREIVVTDYPCNKDTKNSGIIIRPTNMWSINAKCEHKEEAAKFINWLSTDPEAVKILGIERGMPATEVARRVLLEEGIIDEDFKYSVDSALSKPNLPQSLVSLNKEIQEIENDVLSKLAYGVLNPLEAADELIKRLEFKLNELKSLN